MIESKILFVWYDHKSVWWQQYISIQISSILGLLKSFIFNRKTSLSRSWIQFFSCFYRNEELPRDFRLKENSFQMTTFIFDDIAAKTESRLNLVRLDTDKATEESKEALEKIRRRFFDDILFPKLIVKGIRSVLGLLPSKFIDHKSVELLRRMITAQRT